MYGTTLNYESHFFISGHSGSWGVPVARELSGVESLEIGYQNSANVSKPLGYKKGVTTINGPTSQTVSFSRYLIYDDPVLDFTGDSQVMRGSFNYNNNAAYGFESGYLSSYSVNCAVGSVPKVNANFVVYDEMRSGVSASGTTTTNIYIPSQGSITANIENGDEEISSTNRVQLEVDDFFLQSGYTFLEARGDNVVSFLIKGRDGTTLQSLSVPKASLVSEQLTSSSDGAVRLTLNYIGHS